MKVRANMAPVAKRAQAQVAGKANAKPMEVEASLPTECPLCIETLDCTDLNFLPCPCGYRVCLFCYQRLLKEFNAQCPGCRRSYSGDPAQNVCQTDANNMAQDEDEYYRPQNQQQNQAAAAVRGAGGNGDINNQAYGGGGHKYEAGAKYDGNQAPNAPGRAGGPAQPRAGAGAGPAARQRDGLAAAVPLRRDDAPALPLGAVWANQAGHKPPQEPSPPAQAAPGLSDESAWPDLAAAIPQPPPPPPPVNRQQPGVQREARVREDISPARNTHMQVLQRPQQEVTATPPQMQAQQQVNQQQHAQSPSPQRTNQPAQRQLSLETAPSMTQDPVIAPEQLGIYGGIGQLNGGAYHTAQVTTSVFGTTRNINVALGNTTAQQPAYAEATPVMQALDKGKMTAAEASHALMALLTRKEQNGRSNVVGAQAKPPPPGFTAAPAPPPGFTNQVPGFQQNHNNSMLGPADSMVTLNGPLGRYQPIGKPNQNQYQQNNQTGMYGQGMNGRQDMGASPLRNGQQGNYYNLWTGMGVDFPRNGYNNLSAANPTMNGWLHSHGDNGAAMPDNNAVGSLGFGGQLNKPPPPGFGPVNANSYSQGSMDAMPQQNGHEANYYNPLTSNFTFGMGNGPIGARGPPPGMTTFRPQLNA